MREETGLGAARMTYAGHLFEATGTTPALAWVINAIVDALAEFGVRRFAGTVPPVAALQAAKETAKTCAGSAMFFSRCSPRSTKSAAIAPRT